MHEGIECFGPWIKRIEILSVLKGQKPVARQGFYDDELPEIEKFCKEHNLHIIKSEFKVKPEEDGFSEKGIAIEKEDREAMGFVYVSRDEMTAYMAAYKDITLDHVGLGKLLGYPGCCCEFFKSHYKTRSALDNNYEVPLLTNSKASRYKFYVNIFNRRKGIALISHFPCSLDCKESIRIGMKNYRMIRELSSDISTTFRDVLRKEINVNDRSIYFF